MKTKLSPSAQIINKIKKHNDPDATENIDDICDRIFELVDKNKDSKLIINVNTDPDLLVTCVQGKKISSIHR